MQPFKINNRFLVEPGLNQLTDLRDSIKTRLEPRLMFLLTELAFTPGQTITRDELVAKIWDNYGGGDEGLTQGISILRKLLDDASKEMIRTLPKKGYIFNGVVSLEHRSPVITDKAPAPRPGTTRFPRRTVITIMTLVIGLLIILAVRFYTDNSLKGHEVPFPETLTRDGQLIETAANTITTRADDSTTYKLVFAGRFPVKFYRSGQEIPEAGWDPYRLIIDELVSQYLAKNPSVR
ncbi:MAG: hypothetical protein EOO09_05970 [Chitinophagaceae bacterium]|nr:MAG: hypothetical protein EOO09_05970 [Chitinophagaceae bacterium]